MPDTDVSYEFDENLRADMERETLLFLASQLREDHGLPDLLKANYTFVNERLARHYGIPGIYGERFRRVTFDDDHRGGLLGHASLLTLIAYPTRTSPVLRGKWLLDNILGMPPPPPADVPALEENHGATEPRSVRERMDRHRANPACAVCHRVMDPPGLHSSTSTRSGGGGPPTRPGPLSARPVRWPRTRRSRPRCMTRTARWRQSGSRSNRAPTSTPSMRPATRRCTTSSTRASTPSSSSLRRAVRTWTRRTTADRRRLRSWHAGARATPTRLQRRRTCFGRWGRSSVLAARAVPIPTVLFNLGRIMSNNADGAMSRSLSRISIAGCHAGRLRARFLRASSTARPRCH